MSDPKIDTSALLALQPGLKECVLFCGDVPELIKEFDRLKGTNLGLKGSVLDLKIDEATGRLQDDMREFVEFVYEFIYKRVEKWVVVSMQQE